MARTAFDHVDLVHAYKPTVNHKAERRQPRGDRERIREGRNRPTPRPRGVIGRRNVPIEVVCGTSLGNAPDRC